MDKEDPKGVYNIVLTFKGKNYAYLKDNMYVPLMSIDKMFCVTIEDGLFALKRIINWI